MQFDLAQLVRRPSRRPIRLANIRTTQAQAANLFAVYQRILTAWERGAARVAEEYRVTRLTQDSIGDTLGDVADEIQRLVLTLTPALRDWAIGVESVQRRRWVANVLSATSVDLETVLSPHDVDDTLEQAINWNVSLIRDVSDETRKRIGNAVFAGFTRRAPAREIAREISEATGLVRARALRIAADQTSKLGAQLNRARREQAGIDQYIYRHSGKLHPRPWHKARDGKIFKNNDSRIPPDDRAGIPPYCGCTEQAILQFD